MQEHFDQALIAATLAALLHSHNGDDERALQLLRWVLETGKEPTSDPLYIKYVSVSFNLPIAPGVSVELAPTRDALGLLAAELAQAAGDFEEAIDIVEGLDPNAITAVSLAELYDSVERFDEVIDLTDGIRNDDDATALLCLYRGRAFRVLGYRDAARTILREALKSSKRDAAVRHLALIERARVNIEDNKMAEARKDLERLMAEDRSHPDLAGVMALLDR